MTIAGPFGRSFGFDYRFDTVSCGCGDTNSPSIRKRDSSLIAPVFLVARHPRDLNGVVSGQISEGQGKVAFENRSAVDGVVVESLDR